MTQLVAVDKIDANTWNPNVMGEVEYDALKQDMHVHGVNGVDAILISPFNVFFSEEPQTDGFVIVDGEHRWRIAKELGWKDILCEVREISEDDAKALCYRRNRERGNIDPFKEAALFKSELPKLKQAQIAGKYGMDQSTVSHRLSLLKLDPEVVETVEKLPRGIITPSHLEPLASLEPADQKAAYKEVFERWERPRSVKEVEQEISRIKKDRAEHEALAEALKTSEHVKCPKCHEKPIEISHQGLPWVRCRNWHTSWSLKTGKLEYEPQVATQKSLSGETEERVTRTLRCVHTTEELRNVFVDRLKELVPKMDKISTFKVSGLLEGSEFYVDLTSYGKSVAISTHLGHTYTGFRAEDHEYKSGEKSAVHVNDPKELDLIREFIDGAFEGKLGIPVEKVSLKRKHPSPEEPLEADKIETTDNPEESLGAEEVRG